MIDNNMKGDISYRNSRYIILLLIGELIGSNLMHSDVTRLMLKWKNSPVFLQSILAQH